MTNYLWGLAILSCLLACLAWWRTIQLGRKVQALKRNEYYTDNKLQGVSRQITEAVEPLRLQLAKIAVGGQVEEELIRQGKLYWDVRAHEAQGLIEQEKVSANGNMIIVDVRTPKEYAIRHISGAKLIPMEELESRHKAEISPRASKVFVYCGSGDRSRLACDFLSRQGYANLYNVSDGLQRWEGATEGAGVVNLIQIRSTSDVTTR